MVHYWTTWSIRDGLDGQNRQVTMELLKKLTRYMRERWPEWDIQLLTNYTGPTDEVHMLAKHQSPTAREEAQAAFNQDDGARSIMDEWRTTQQKLGGEPILVNNRHYYYRIVDVN